MLVSLGWAAAGFVLTVVAADQLLLAAGRLSARLRHLTAVAVGLAAALPELIVTGDAVAADAPQIAAGTLVGANVLNLTLVLGVAGLVRPVILRTPQPRRQAPLSAAAVILFGLLLFGGLTVVDGLVLAGAAAVAALLLARFVGAARLRDPGSPRTEAVRLALGLAGTVAGVHLLVSGGMDLATHLDVSPTVLGFTLVALGTSLPDLLAVVRAQRRREPDLVVGSLLGANLFGSLLGGALLALGSDAREVAVRLSMIDALERTGFSPVVVALMAGTSLLAWLVLARDLRLSRPESVLLACAYLVALPLLG
ncbi:sodium:calcium antiporter [Bailinhaonella thermotolerans]|uniref:Sodium:calcium antiporter n=1 Tax=Bailinhaonella thermotolerans TaxID=1070861 RepID=A0A3A4A9Q8_9ACTN|nr:sodium:calcium antiporter [Bailinhaonella thermotolerans]RJL22780.1 sodium:calcium antiporter [Bailinhaonella thermotolerans]